MPNIDLPQKDMHANEREALAVGWAQLNRIDDRKLSDHFYLSEFLSSESAERHEEIIHAQWRPPVSVVDNLSRLIVGTLEPIRRLLAFPIVITSGYRCVALNALVGGSGTSQHLRGEAADCQLSMNFLTSSDSARIKRIIESEVYDAVGAHLRRDINSNFYLFALSCIFLDYLDLDQVIHEYGAGPGNPSWVHLSSSARQNKRQILITEKGKGFRSLTLEQALLMGCAL